MGGGDADRRRAARSAREECARQGSLGRRASACTRSGTRTARDAACRQIIAKAGSVMAAPEQQRSPDDILRVGEGTSSSTQARPHVKAPSTAAFGSLTATRADAAAARYCLTTYQVEARAASQALGNPPAAGYEPTTGFGLEGFRRATAREGRLSAAGGLGGERAKPARRRSLLCGSRAEPWAGRGGEAPASPVGCGPSLRVRAARTLFAATRAWAERVTSPVGLGRRAASFLDTFDITRQIRSTCVPAAI